MTYSSDNWEINEGWKPMVEALTRLAINYCTTLGIPFTIEQVKEKFGTLRYYYSGGDEFVDKLVDVVENQSAYMCEVCGKYGTLRKGGWLKTLCDEHQKEREEKHHGT